ALRPEAQPAQGQVDVVADHQQVFQRQLVEVHHLPHTSAAQVHEGLRLDQEHLLLALVKLGDLGLKAVLEPRGTGAGRHGVHDGEPDVVPGARVAVSGVAQAHDDFHFSSSSSAALARPMTSGSACSAGAAAAAASGSTTGGFTWTTTASASAVAWTPG